MPLATPEQVAEYIAKYGPIRLACMYCFRDDFDGVRLLPGDWRGIEECQSLQAALSIYDETDEDPAPRGYSVMDWWTHKGTCSECVESPNKVRGK